MQVVPIALAAAVIFALSNKKKAKAVSKEPQIKEFDRVKRLLNGPAVAASLSSLTPPPSVMFAYISESSTLERVTQVMMAQAYMFPNVEFYQMPISAIKEVIKAEGSPPKNIAGTLVGVHPDGAVWLTYIYPEDDIKDIAVKVAHRVFFAITGTRPEIKGS